MERELIDWLRKNVPPHQAAPLGLTDDAALVSFGSSPVVVTIDTLTDGVDFDIQEHEPHRIGRQALGANLSDLAAMAARPVAAVVSLALPRNGGAGLLPLQLAVELYRGLLPMAHEFNLAIVGGDTNTFDGPLVLTVTAMGEPTGAGVLQRSGGQIGDWLLVTGSLGGSILGHMLDFVPRVMEAITLHERYALHAAIDVSDGLALDASRLAEASGCGALLYMDEIPIDPDAYRLARLENASNVEKSALRHALGDGQDFELLIAAAPSVAEAILRDRSIPCPIRHIGELIREAGLWQQSAEARPHPLEPTGWLHS